LIVIVSCSEKPPADEQKFMLVYIDLISFPDSLHNNPEMFEKFREDVFNKHGLKREDYNRMIEYYNSKPELWDEFFQKAIRYVETSNDSVIIK